MRVGLFNTAFVGDLALMSRLVDALALAGCELTLFSNGAGCKLYQYDRRIKKTVQIKKERGAKKVASIFKIAEQIKDEQVDVLILAHRSLTSGLIGLACRSMRVVVFSDSTLAGLFAEKRTTVRTSHESERYLALAEEIADTKSIADSKMSLFGDANLSHFSAAFPEFFKTPEQSFFVCAPGSVWRTKRYPPRLLGRLLIRLLKARPTSRCVLSGGPTDHQTMTEVLDEISQVENSAEILERVIDARDCLPLPELIELIRRAEFVLTPDSAPLHIASATGTRAFAFFGPTPFNTGFGPLGNQSEILSYESMLGRPLACQPCSKHGQKTCPLGHHSCLADLPPDVVAQRMLEFLSR